ncbi:MAG: arginine deiminase family protein [Thermoplasmata archaeon]|nr:arginine deiminase family protein [Thermoplasmata archaeon]MCI4361821.1 arginine deiminase family protein [Thermoplasmata archaeon]
MTNTARAEWQRLREVLVHRPGIEMFFGLMEPYSFLYERAFSVTGAIYEHAALEHALTDAGVAVHRFKRFAVEVGSTRPEFVEQVREYAERLVQYTGPKEMVALSRQALRRNLPSFDAETLFNILLLRPSVHLQRHAGTRVILPKVTLDGPLANLYFLRDQQALTAGGFVLGRMAKPQRRNEPLLTGTLLRTSGATIAGAVQPPGTFEGGDFLPLGSFALLGTGDRTNASGVRQVLGMPIGFDEVGVVHQPAHPAVPGRSPDPMIDMHLDTYCNIPGEGIAVGCEVLLKAARVEVYRRRARGAMVRDPKTRSLSDFLVEKGFEIVPLSTLEQMSYASNFLCLSDRKILAVEVEQELDGVVAGLAAAAHRDRARYGALLALVRRERGELRDGRGFFPHIAALRDRGVTVVPLSLQEITGGYGGAHCMTCVMNRSST